MYCTVTNLILFALDNRVRNWEKYFFRGSKRSHICKNTLINTQTYINSFHIPIPQHLHMIYIQNILPQRASDSNTTNTLFNK